MISAVNIGVAYPSFKKKRSLTQIGLMTVKNDSEYLPFIIVN